jgi:SPP1 gp7 family putative phage head morphogenesis protein
VQNDLTRHQLYIQRLSAGEFNKLQPLLKKLRDDINLKILNSTTLFQAERLSIMLKEINALILDRTEPITTLFNDFAEYEYEYTAKYLDSVTVPTVTIAAGVTTEQLLATITKTKMDLDGKKLTIDGILKVFAKGYTREIKQEIQFGIAEGETTQQIAKRITELSNNRTKAQAKAVVQTVANHVGTQARAEVFKENKHLFKGDRWMSVLDSHTSPICIDLDGRIFPIGEGQYPPAHYHCRSIRVPELYDKYKLVKVSTRQSESGPVSNKLNYSDWLKTQSKAVQIEVLGEARAKAFRANKLPLNRYIDRQGVYYTLDELKAKDLIE